MVFCLAGLKPWMMAISTLNEVYVRGIPATLRTKLKASRRTKLSVARNLF